MVKRIYPVKRYESDDERFLFHCKEVKRLKELVYNEESNEESNEDYKSLYKTFHNKIRESIGTDRLIGIVTGSTKGEVEPDIVHVFIYDMQATDNNFFTQKFDEELGMPYFEVEEQEGENEQ